MMMKRRYKKRFIWDERREEMFINVWREHYEELRECKKKSHIYVKMAKELAEVDVNASPFEVKMKISNLTTKYRKEQRLSGGSPSKWPQYEVIREIIEGSQYTLSEEEMDSKLHRYISNFLHKFKTKYSVVKYEESEFVLLDDSTMPLSPTAKSSVSDRSHSEKGYDLDKRLESTDVNIQRLLTEVKKLNEIEKKNSEFLKVVADSMSTLAVEVTAYLRRQP